MNCSGVRAIDESPRESVVVGVTIGAHRPAGICILLKTISMNMINRRQVGRRDGRRDGRRVLMAKKVARRGGEE